MMSTLIWSTITQSQECLNFGVEQGDPITTKLAFFLCIYYVFAFSSFKRSANFEPKLCINQFKDQIGRIKNYLYYCVHYEWLQVRVLCNLPKNI
jgi:hypothetical protein